MCVCVCVCVCVCTLHTSSCVFSLFVFACVCVEGLKFQSYLDGSP